MTSPAKESVMRLLTMKQVCERVGFCRTHVNRFRTDEAYSHLGFPKPVRIGFKVLWSEGEIDDWITAQLAKRQLP